MILMVNMQQNSSARKRLRQLVLAERSHLLPQKLLPLCFSATKSAKGCDCITCRNYLRKY